MHTLNAMTLSLCAGLAPLAAAPGQDSPAIASPRSSSPGPSAPQDIKAVIKEADVVIATAQRGLEDALKKGVVAPAPPAADFDPKPLLDHAAAMPGQNERAQFIHPALHDLWYYYSYHALRAGDAQRCAPLRVITTAADRFVEKEDPPRRADIDCAWRYHDLAFARALVTKSPDFKKICVARVVFDSPRLAGKAEGICDAWAAEYRNPAVACDRYNYFYARHPYGPAVASKCRAMARAYAGDDKTCAQTSEHAGEAANPLSWDAMNLELCNGIAAFARGGNNPAACGGREVCLALMDPAAAIARYGGALRESVCMMVPGKRKLCEEQTDRALAQSRQGFAEGLKSFSAMLQQTELFLQAGEAKLAAPDPQAAREVDERLERIARLRWRAETQVPGRPVSVSGPGKASGKAGPRLGSPVPSHKEEPVIPAQPPPGNR